MSGENTYQLKIPSLPVLTVGFLIISFTVWAIIEIATIEIQYYTINGFGELLQCNEENAIYRFEYYHTLFSTDSVKVFKAYSLFDTAYVSGFYLQATKNKVLIEGAAYKNELTNQYIPHGVWTYYQPTFPINSKGIYKIHAFTKGVKNGYALEYYLNSSQIEWEGHFENGYKDGVFTLYRTDGELDIEEYYVKDYMYAKGYNLREMVFLNSELDLLNILENIERAERDLENPQSLSLLVEAFNEHNDNAYVSMLIADHYTLIANYEDALHWYTKTLTYRHPRTYEVYANKASIYIAQISDQYVESPVASNFLKISLVDQLHLLVQHNSKSNTYSKLLSSIERKITKLHIIKSEYLMGNFKLYAVACRQKITDKTKELTIGVVLSGGVISYVVEETVFKALGELTNSLFSDQIENLRRLFGWEKVPEEPETPYCSICKTYLKRYLELQQNALYNDYGVIQTNDLNLKKNLIANIINDL